MLGLGTAVNVGAILLGGTLGLLGQRTLPERTTNTILQIMGLFTAVVGLRMLWPGCRWHIIWKHRFFSLPALV